MFFPSVIETTGRSSRGYDLPTKLLQDRIIYFCGPVTEESANIAIMQLLWLNADDPDKEIDFYINSPGGSVVHGFAIKDVIDNISAKVNTIGTGQCASMGAYLLAAGTGTRRATKRSRIMIHAVSGGADGTIHDMKLDYKETQHLHDKIMQDLALFSDWKYTADEFNEMSSRDKYMSPEEYIELGLLDSVV